MSTLRCCIVCFGTVFQTVGPLCFIYPETSSRVTLASLGVVFQTNLVVLLFCCLVFWLFSCLVFWLSGVVCRFGWKPIPSAARVTRDEVSGLEIRRNELSGRQYLIDNALTHLDVFVCLCTVFQTVVPPCIIYPETSSRVTLASLGIVFQTNLVVWLFSCLVVWLSGVVFQTNLIVLYKKISMNKNR